MPTEQPQSSHSFVMLLLAIIQVTTFELEEFFRKTDAKPFTHRGLSATARDMSAFQAYFAKHQKA
jgi:hypothetical protein